MTSLAGAARTGSAAQRALAAVVLLGLPAAAAAQDQALIPPLRVVSLDVSAAPELAGPPKVSPPKPTWRTTFGSERRHVAPEPTPGDAEALGADVVLMHGVTSVLAVRRAFPARAWRLVFSRQILQSEDPFDPWSRDAVATVPTTAVAVRYRPGQRVAGQEHILNLKAAETGPPMPAVPAATAVRVSLGGNVLWLMATAHGAACAASGSACPARDTVEAWRAAKLAAGEHVVLGGALQGADSQVMGPFACAHEAIEVARPGSAPADRATAVARDGLGCVASAATPPFKVQPIAPLADPILVVTPAAANAEEPAETD